MVLQKAVDNLKGRPMNERKAVASGIAMLIVAILFIGWGILFFKNIQRTREQAEPIGDSLRGTFNLSSVTETQKHLVNGFPVYTQSLNNQSV